MTNRIGDGRSIRIVQNKDDSLTAYVPARWAGLFTDMLREGQTGDEVSLFERPAGAWRQVLEVADRGGYDLQAAHRRPQSRGISRSRLIALPDRRAMSISRRLKRLARSSRVMASTTSLV